MSSPNKRRLIKRDSSIHVGEDELHHPLQKSQTGGSPTADGRKLALFVDDEKELDEMDLVTKPNTTTDSIPAFSHAEEEAAAPLLASRQKSFAISAAAYDASQDHLDTHMGFTELVMAQEDSNEMDLTGVSSGIRETLLGHLRMNRVKKRTKSRYLFPPNIAQSGRSSSELSKMYLAKSVSRANVLPESFDEKVVKVDSEVKDGGSLRERRKSTVFNEVDEEEDKDDESLSHHLMMNIFSSTMIEQFLLMEREYPDAGDIEMEAIDTIEFSLKEVTNDLVVRSKSMPLSYMKLLLNQNAEEVQEMNRERQKKDNDEAQSAIPLGSHWGMDEDGKKLFRSRMEINSYPLEARKMITSDESLEGLKKRLGLYAISQEGVMTHGHHYFINFDGYSKEACELAVDELTSTMEAQVEDYAQRVDLHDLMQLLLAVGANSPPIAMTARHCVLLGLYPIQCVVTSEKLILIESKSLAKSKNLILETTADEIAKVIRHLITTKLKHKNNPDLRQPNSPVNKRRAPKEIHFDHICYEAVFITIWKIHINAIASVQSRALLCHRVYNARAYVSLEDQKQMYMVKMQASKLQETLKMMSSKFEGILGQDVAMAFMNLSRLKMDDSIYRMTVDKKKTLSTFDDRVTKASHDIELVLYAHYLRYAKLEKEAQRIIDMLENVEQWQTLQSLNTQTKVLVANTYMTVLGCTIAFGGAVTGAFGMNLDNAYVNWPEYTFYVVCGVTLLFIVVGTKITIDYLRQYGVIPKQLL